MRSPARRGRGGSEVEGRRSEGGGLRSVSRAKGPTDPSLGQSASGAPGHHVPSVARAESPFDPVEEGATTSPPDGAGLQPSAVDFCPVFLGRWPRLGWRGPLAR